MLQIGSVWAVMNVSTSLEILLRGPLNFKFLGDELVNKVRLAFTDNIPDSTIYIAGNPIFFNPLVEVMLKFRNITTVTVTYRIVFPCRLLFLIV
jgi:hypothetical protein